MSKNVDYIASLGRTEQEARGKIRTYSGAYVNPLNLQPDDVRLVDIAHHLSLLCRYTGACPWHYSVAQHSVYVSHAMAAHYGDDPKYALAGLMHDAAEAYLNDIASPVKHDPRFQFYRDAEDAADLVIFKYFNIDVELLPLTKIADDDVFVAETRGWWGVGVPYPVWTPQEAKNNFIKEYYCVADRR